MSDPPRALSVLPRRRREGLLTREVGDELVVYDLSRHRAFCLNPSARAVWGLCDGRTDTATGIEAVAATLGVGEAEGPETGEALRLALDRLARAGLLEDGAETSASPLPTRRELGRKLGLAAMWLPVVASIAAPTAAQNGSCLSDVTQGRPCAPRQCGQECGGPGLCGTGRLQCRNLGGGNYRCVPPTAGSCP